MPIDPCVKELEKLTSLEKTRVSEIWLFYKRHNRIPSNNECSQIYGHARQIWHRFFSIMVDKNWIHQSDDYYSRGFTTKAIAKITKADNKCHE